MNQNQEKVVQPTSGGLPGQLALQIGEVREQLALLEAEGRSTPTGGGANTARRIRELRMQLRQLDAAAKFYEDGQRGGLQGEEGDREGRRAVPMSFALRADLRERLTKFRDEGGTINVSGICNEAIERELDRIQSGNAVVQRLRVELTERRGPSWTAGYQTGRKWAEETASWLEITEYATRYTSRDVGVKVAFEGEPEMYYEFRGRFLAPERDYGRDHPGGDGAPGFTYTADDGELKWQWNVAETVTYWRGWLAAVHEVYDDLKDQLQSVVDQLPPEPSRPQDVDPDEIPF